MTWKIWREANFGTKEYNNWMKILEKSLMENLLKQKKESKTWKKTLVHCSWVVKETTQ